MRAQIEALHGGDRYRVISSWLDEDPNATTTVNPSVWGNYAYRDINEIHHADLFILDTIGENTRGGREVEWGVALRGGGHHLIRVGPMRNVFHTLADVSYDTWEDCLANL